MEKFYPSVGYLARIDAEIVCTCLRVEAPWCVSGYAFPTIYEEQTVVFSFTDKFHRRYYTYVDIDEYGWATVETKNLPAGLLNPYAGEFLVNFWDPTDLHRTRKFFFDGEKVYNCLTFVIVDVNTGNLLLNSPHYVSLHIHHCCCERLCPPPKPDCNANRISFSLQE